MEGSTAKTVLWVVAFAVIATGGYLLYTKVISPPDEPATKEEMVNAIIAFSDRHQSYGSYSGLMGLDTAYITSWYNAIQAKQPIFRSGNSKFDVISGRAVA